MLPTQSPGGETSSVIGTILGAHEQWTATSDATSTAVDGDSARHLFFVYNNPDEVLLPFVRSRTVIEVRCVSIPLIASTIRQCL